MSFGLSCGRDGRAFARGTSPNRQRSTGRSFQGPPASSAAYGRSPSVGRSSSVRRSSSVGPASANRPRGSSPNFPTWQQGSGSNLPSWQRIATESPSPKVVEGAWCDKEADSPRQVQKLSSQSLNNQGPRSPIPEPIKPEPSKFQRSSRKSDNESPISNVPPLDLPVFVASFPSTLASFQSRHVRSSVSPWEANPDEIPAWMQSPSAAADDHRTAPRLTKDPPPFSFRNSSPVSSRNERNEATMRTSKSPKGMEIPDCAAIFDANSGSAEQGPGVEIADFAISDVGTSKPSNSAEAKTSSAEAKCIRISDFAVTDFDPTMQQSALARSTAMACGLPATYAHESAKSNNNAAIAMKMLEASRKQREHQDSLLHQAQKQMLQAARSEHERAMREASKRVGGAEPANPVPNTSMRLQQRLASASANPAAIDGLNQSLASTPRFQQSPRAKQTMSPRGTSAATHRQRSQSPWSFTKARVNRPQDPANGPSPSPSSSQNSSFSSIAGSPARSSPSVKSASKTRRQARQSSPPVSPRGSSLAPSQLNSPSMVPDESTIVDSLLERNMLSSEPRPWAKDPEGIPDDISHVQAMFCAQLPDSYVSRVLRLENRQSAHYAVYEAVRQTVTMANELELWHGTSFESVRNIVLSGFNRAYCGRHGTKLGNGTYFAISAKYSVRFCDRKQKKKVVMLADVIAGCWTKGSPDLIEPPHIDEDCLSRYDSTVDDIDKPTMFCVFRDFQALPRYLVEFTMPAST